MSLPPPHFSLKPAQGIISYSPLTQTTATSSCLWNFPKSLIYITMAATIPCLLWTCQGDRPPTFRLEKTTINLGERPAVTLDVFFAVFSVAICSRVFSASLLSPR